MQYVNATTVDSAKGLLLSFVLAFVLTISPLPNWANWLRPEWVPLVLISWILIAPDRVGLGTAWFSGLLIDILENTAFGEHALIFTVLAYYVQKFRGRIIQLPFWPKSLIVFGLILLVQILQFWLESLMGHITNNIFYWAPVLTTTLFWPWVMTLIEYWRGHKNDKL